MAIAAQVAALHRAGVRLCVFDFDLCVLSIHSFGLRLEPLAVAARAPLERDFVDLPLFRGLVRELGARGVAVAVASFGRYDVIQAYLDRALEGGAAQLFTRGTISTPSSVGGVDGCSVPGGKNRQLFALAKQFGVEAGAVLFFDGAAGEGGRN